MLCESPAPSTDTLTVTADAAVKVPTTDTRSPAGGPMTDLATNVLCYGDNLHIVRRYLPDAAVDLVYLDPPVK
jgi:hypothetical protein